MMKTRKATVIGTLYIERLEFYLVRIEASQGFGPDVTMFNVTKLTPVTYDFDNDSKPIFAEPFTVARSGAWTVCYFPTLEITVEDAGEEVKQLIELDIPTPAEISEAEWERMLNDVDTHRFDTETENVE